MGNVQGSKKKKTWMWILGWLFIFPLPLTILLLKKKDIKASVKYGIIAISWVIYLLIAIGVNASESETESSDVVSRSVQTNESNPSVKAPIEVENIIFSSYSNDMILGELYQVESLVVPSDADDKKVTWTSGDESIVTVDDSGMVHAVGGGKTTVTATTSNGITASTDITVDASKRVMHLNVTRSREDSNNIGDEWSYVTEINGESTKREYVISKGDVLDCHARFKEDDDNPDVGIASKKITVTEKDFQQGFTVTMDLYVRENGGVNKGDKAHFIVTYEFTVQ